MCIAIRFFRSCQLQSSVNLLVDVKEADLVHQWEFGDQTDDRDNEAQEERNWCIVRVV